MRHPATKTKPNAEAPGSICIIGAGTCGLLSLRALVEAGFSVDCLEMDDHVGGLWSQKNQRSAAYDSLTIDSSKAAMALSDFPFDEAIPDFPSHQQVADYLENFAQKFALHKNIFFQRRVERVEPRSSGYGVYSRNLASGELVEKEYRHLLVASGHHHRPALPPQLPDAASGIEWIHSRDYRNPEQPLALKDRDVIVVGFGNSAADIAVELAGIARSVTLSVRRGAWVIPKYLLGKPIDQGRLIPTWLPGKFRRRLVTLSLVALRGKMSSYGLPAPDHLVGEAHPTLSDDLPSLVQAGKIRVMGPLADFGQKLAIYADGQESPADAIIYCTGYDIDLPYLQDQNLPLKDNSLPLFQRIFLPGSADLSFIGLAQTIGPIIPVAEKQVELLIDYLRGDYLLPSQAEQEAAIEKEQASIEARFVPSRRHTMQVDPPLYLRALAKERARGRRRAKKARTSPSS